jgi:outer membrane protein assembly factor BamB
MDARPLLRLVAIAVLVLATALGLRAIRRWPARRTSGLVAGTLAVLALAGFALSTLDLLAPHASVPDALSVYYIESGTLAAASAATGTVRWRYTPPPGPILQPLLDHGVFYLRTDGALRALRARDGMPLWAAPVEGRAEQQQLPTADQGVVYATSSASVVALRTADGSPLWQTSPSATPGSPTSAPHVANGRVYVAFNAAAGSVYALDARTGTIRWTHTEEQADATSLTVADGSVYAAFGARGTGVQPTTVVALNADDGAVRWTYTVEGDADPLAVTNGVLVVSSRLLGLLALDAASGSLLWQRGDLGLHGDLPNSPRPIVADGVVYLSGVISDGQHGVVLAQDARTGRERWRTVLDQYADVYASLAGPMLYVGGASAYGLRASDGHVVWRYGSRTQFYQPAVAAGVVFVGSGDVGFHLFGIGSNDFLNALDARTGQLYWRTSFIGDDPLLVPS